MEKDSKKIFITIVILAFAGIIISYIFAYDYYISEIIKYYGYKQNALLKFTSSICGSENSFINCDKVVQSNYSKFGQTPAVVYGMFFFLVIIFLTASIFYAKEKYRNDLKIFLFWVISLAALYDLYLLIIGIFVINALCLLCVFTYILIWASLVILYRDLKGSGIKPFTMISNIKNSISSNMKNAVLYSSFTVLLVLASIFISYGVNSYLQERRIKVNTEARQWILHEISKNFRHARRVNPEVSEPVLIGKKNAPVTIVEFSDFLCPVSSRVSRILNQFISENPNLAKVLFINFPLDTECNSLIGKEKHSGSCLLAKGAICANRQGKFNEYSKMAFNIAIEQIVMDQLEGIVALTSIDLMKFKNCIVDPSVSRELESQINEGIRLDLKKTPGLFINGKFLKFMPEKEILKKIVEDELRMMDMKKTLGDKVKK